MRDTSVSNYHEHRDSGALGRQTAKLYEFLEGGGRYSRAEIAEATGMRLSSVCGRIHELLDAGLVKEAPKRPCRVTGRTIHPVYRPRHAMQLDLLDATVRV